MTRFFGILLDIKKTGGKIMSDKEWKEIVKQQAATYRKRQITEYLS